MQNRIKNILKSKIEEIFLIGVWDLEDQEFIVNSDYVYLEFEAGFLEIKAIDGYGKLKISIVESVENKNLIEGMVEGKIKTSQFIFVNPLSENYINAVTFFNLDENNNDLVTDVLLIELNNKQKIFIDPSFVGINIGGIEQMEFWEDNLLNFIQGTYPSKTELYL